MMSSQRSTTGRGVVAAGHGLTASAAGHVLEQGGNAFDAAIAAMAMACVAEPVLCSPGGGGFAMIRHGETGSVSSLDFFPHTPRQRRQEALQGTEQIFANFGAASQAFRIGPGTVATPGFCTGIHALHRAGASLPLQELFAPAIEAAQSGITITPFQHFLSTVVEPILTASQGARRLFTPDGSLLEPGSTVVNPGLAEALAMLAVSPMTDCDVGRAVVDAQQAGGNLTMDDLTGYEATVREPLTVKVGQSLVHMNPFPAAGGLLVAHSLSRIDSTNPVDVAQAFRSTANARAEASDELGRLDPALLRRQGTTHISVVDAHGTACAVTVSNGAGNGEIVDGFGFMLNNILGEDDLNPAGPGRWPVNTRLSSMMCPTIIEQPDGGLVALGSGGSNRIRTAIAQVVARLCFDDADIASAVDAPRLHVEGEHLDFEDRYDDVTREELCAHFPDHLAWPNVDLFYGGVHAVRLDPSGRAEGRGDVRRDGTSLVIN